MDTYLKRWHLCVGTIGNCQLGKSLDLVSNNSNPSLIRCIKLEYP